MTIDNLRDKYLQFFKEKNHQIISSASLIPENDPSLLFTNSGMSPLVPYFKGENHPAGQRLVNSQKCFRAEDIEEIGDGRHSTFFEMLGNWSLGDYYKKEQLTWWFEFLFDYLKIDPERIYQTVYAGSADGKIKKDHDSIKILQDLFSKYKLEASEGPETLTKGDLGPGIEIDFNQYRIFAYRDKNWWQRGDAIGELGGPDSETFYDTQRVHDKKYGEFCHLNCDCGRFIEIGNSVFMQYQKTANSWQELKNKNVDFGGGLERIMMALEGENNIFKTEFFSLAVLKLEEISQKKYDENQVAFEVIADHIKAATFIIGDDKGIIPSNTDQGYIVRRLLRRAIRFGRQLEIKEKNWTEKIAQIYIKQYESSYPELKRNHDFILENIKKEEEKFQTSLEKGLIEFNKIATKDIEGKNAFYLYQSYGFPLEITEELAKEKGLKVNKDEFFSEQKKHQEKSRTAAVGKFKGGLADSSIETTKLHTAAHLLLSALKKVLGDHVEQRGSNITAERLRFDFTHSKRLSEEEIKLVEDLVNQAINKKYEIACQEMSLEEAKKIGAAGVFDSRYGEKVKVYIVGQGNEGDPLNWQNYFSKEICGGPHVKNLAELGKFKISKQESSSAGVRRIKAKLL
jgi:alanyl-tRNA synthetase